MKTPERPIRPKNPEVVSHSPRYVVDYERCSTPQQLREIVEIINRYQYQLVSVTQDPNGIYTVFFRRCLLG